MRYPLSFATGQKYISVKTGAFLRVNYGQFLLNNFRMLCECSDPPFDRVDNGVAQ